MLRAENACVISVSFAMASRQIQDAPVRTCQVSSQSTAGAMQKAFGEQRGRKSLLCFRVPRAIALQLGTYLILGAEGSSGACRRSS